jgi:predicted DNA-binding transcriptional regulator YafY
VTGSPDSGAGGLPVDVRDASLRDRGMPIANEAGPGGGVRLNGDDGRTPVHLAILEIVALWLGARLSRGSSDLP